MAVAWLLAQRRSLGSGAGFPIYLGEGIEPSPGRLSWCYGDPGIAAALLTNAPNGPGEREDGSTPCSRR